MLAGKWKAGQPVGAANMFSSPPSSPLAKGINYIPPSSPLYIYLFYIYVEFGWDIAAGGEMFGFYMLGCYVQFYSVI